MSLYLLINSTTTTRMKITFIFLNFLLASNGQNIEIVTKLVEDLIQSENKPTVLSVISCWSQLDNLQMIKTSKVPIQLSHGFKISPHIVDDNTNKLCYFIDMRCSSSYDFLYKIEGEYFAHPYRWILFE